jgi:hypothetical protein
MRRILTALLTLGFLFPTLAQADEGMWTLDNFPTAKVQAAYGFTAGPQFLDHLRESSVRLPGCSGSFVSKTGLIMSNHHCARSCIQNISSPQNDYIEKGFFAKTEADEPKCPGFEIVSLIGITHVTSTVNAATAGSSGADYNAKQRAIFGQLEAACQTDAQTQCQVVSLYHGGIYDLYRYHKYTDVRLVFAPEETMAFFGGDPDNFTFPRYDLDCAFLRAYENDKPVTPPDYFPWSPSGPKDNELVFVTGNPGSTSRLLTVAELESLRDRGNPFTLRYLSELRGMLTRFSQESPEHARIAINALFGIENTIKATQGHESTLLDPTFFAQKVADERAMRAAIDANPAWHAKYGAAWDDIAKVEVQANRLALVQNFREGAPGAYLGYARTLVRAATERTKPSAMRLREFGDAALPGLQARLGARIPIYPDLENMQLAFTLTKMREFLGADDPYVRAMLGNASPQQVADHITGGSKLADPAVRKALYDGGEAAIAASTDPAIVLMRNVDAIARATRKEYEDTVTAPLRKNEELIAGADFALHGTSKYPDATFTLRVTYGSVKGYDENGTFVKPFTTIGGAYLHATGQAPYALPQSWLDAKSHLALDTPLNFVSTVDIIGGNSGSPVVNAKGQIVGLIFDGDIESLGGDYGYDIRQNRGVAVHSSALLTALRDVYHANRLVTELSGT